jgi:penicillin-binding protein 1A
MPKRKSSKKTKKGTLGEKIKKLLVNLFVFCFFSTTVAVLIIFFYYIKDFPRPEVFTERQLAQTTNIYDKTGEVLLYEIYGEERRTWTSLDVVPEHLKQAVIAVEDANFYNHYGIDLRGIIRAILIDIQLGKPVSGGSTICQQLIRSTFLTNKKTVERKIREIILSIELDRRYSKDKILEWYLNQVPFGQNAYGIEAASQTYFKKSASEISIPEAAILAALIQAPYRLSPYGENKDMLLERKNYVLDRMTSENFLTVEEAEKKKKEEIVFIDPQTEIKAPYFTLWVKQELENKYGIDFLRKSGWNIYTSLDWEIQKIA